MPPTGETNELFQVCKEVLQAMGDDSVRRGYTFGLRAYADLHRILYPGSFGSTRWEEPITEGLKLGLCRRGYSSSTENCYPDSSERCDLIIRLPSGRRIWIETKAFFTEYFGVTYEACDAIKTNAWKQAILDKRNGKDIRHDFDKLNSLTREHADLVGLLFLGFDRVGCSLEDGGFQDRLAARIPELASWHQSHAQRNGESWADRYPNRAGYGYRDRLLLWCRDLQNPTADEPATRRYEEASRSPNGRIDDAVFDEAENTLLIQYHDANETRYPKLWVRVRSQDGVEFEGNYGYSGYPEAADRDRRVRLTLNRLANGELLFRGEWSYGVTGDCGTYVFHLRPVS
jgi:hypothetical protein